MSTATLTVEDRACELVQNWKKFESFGWYSAVDDDPDRIIKRPDDWAIIYTHNRDSGPLDLSNAAEYLKALKPFIDAETPSVVEERHDHWAVGWVEGFAIQVFDQGEITPAFEAFHTLKCREENYPVLNEDDFSNREYEAVLHDIEHSRYPKDFVNLPENWVGEVYQWLSENDPHTIDGGQTPNDDDVLQALFGLNYTPENPDDWEWSDDDASA